MKKVVGCVEQNVQRYRYHHERNGLVDNTCRLLHKDHVIRLLILQWELIIPWFGTSGVYDPSSPKYATEDFKQRGKTAKYLA